jgi:hypothetical protein
MSDGHDNWLRSTDHLSVGQAYLMNRVEDSWINKPVPEQQVWNCVLEACPPLGLGLEHLQ